MRKYAITEVSQLIGVKTHVIRYWEEHSGLFSVQRDECGKRLYEWKDIVLLMQFEHLVYKQKYGVQHATNRIVELLQDPHYRQRRSMCFSILKGIDSQQAVLHRAHDILLELKTLQKADKKT